MFRFCFLLLVLFWPVAAFAACGGIFPNNTVCGNVSGGSGVPGEIPISRLPPSNPTPPGGTNGQIQFNSSGVFGGRTPSGNGTTIATTTGSLGTGNCIKADANGNLVDAGRPCSSGNGGGGVFQLDEGAGITLSPNPVTTSGSVALREIPSGTVLGNFCCSGSPAAPQETTPSAVLDSLGAAQGSILYRGASGWTALAPGAAGQVLTTGGTGANPGWAAGSGGSAAPIHGYFTVPTTTSVGTVNIPAGAKWAKFIMSGGGGGGSNANGGGATGGMTCLASIAANYPCSENPLGKADGGHGGFLVTASAIGDGGDGGQFGSLCDAEIKGEAGKAPMYVRNSAGQISFGRTGGAGGGAAYFGNGGPDQHGDYYAGYNGLYGGGGQGGVKRDNQVPANTLLAGSGGGGGALCIKTILNPAASYKFQLGAGGAGAAGSTNSSETVLKGGDGGVGRIDVEYGQ